MFSVSFSFSITRIYLVHCGFCLDVFRSVLFFIQFIHDEYSIVLIIFFLINLIYSGSFGNRNKVGNNPRSLNVWYQSHFFFLRVQILRLVMFRLFARTKFIFCVISIVVFRVTSSGDVFRLSVSGKARFLPAV